MFKINKLCKVINLKMNYISKTKSLREENNDFKTRIKTEIFKCNALIRNKIKRNAM